MKIRHSSVIKSKVRLDQVHLTQAPLVKQKSPLDRGASEITAIAEPDRILTTTSRVPARFRPIPAARVIVFPLLLCLGSATAWAQQKDQQQMRGLDEQVQEIKSDVLSIAAELNQLEEKLLYPSDTQVAVFVALSKGDQLRLDAVRIQIDGQLVAHYIYSFKELDALRKGGVQRIYVGNVPTGDHKLEVVVDGKLESGADFSRTERFTFHKEVKPKLVGLTLAGSGNTPIALGEW